ncbi:hypothetical protein FHS18_000749 [Paenibacillus phyllosphaerae]|uniref:Uncharacterized protein n=1 Tax=Paenibacillus phyllosphaerae TaxID=274593 RepID=A0A7W5AUX2_9BACL|nr:hypothetical protein [Paenibacillus phyllosphaerae]MBB3108721.1 hypothetical protein [Paenibacillus phyllosphaerae]
MTNPVKQKLLIKQVIGRMLLDTEANGCSFSLEPHENGWSVRVEQVEPAIGREIERLASELNLFYFEENTATGELRKWWLYDLDLPQLAWNADERTLSLVLSSRVSYTNERV